MAKLTITPDGLVQIIGKQPSAEILEELKGRIGPDEAAIVVPAHDMSAFLEELVGETADADEDWDFADLVRRRAAGEPA